MEYLDFEKPIEELENNLVKCYEIAKETGIDTGCKKIEKEIEKKQKEIFKNLSPWQRVQLSRHPNRPFTLDYIKALAGDTFLELHGDRNFADDKAMIGGLGKIGDQTYMFVGMQKWRNTKEPNHRNFCKANPEGYPKALRLMKMAEKANIPVVAFIDTPGAYFGIEAEERGQGEAIARNILEMTQLTVPIITIIIGEGASGGALGIGVGDRVFMLENTWYSVISPESCSSILWHSWEFKEQAAEALKLTSKDMKKLKLIDDIIEEPIGGAHRNPEQTYQNVAKKIVATYAELKLLPKDQLVNERMAKYAEMGEFSEK
jgi:acetyl-CoA carboxylase carboxyl transferase subunit alpha